MNEFSEEAMVPHPPRVLPFYLATKACADQRHSKLISAHWVTVPKPLNLSPRQEPLVSCSESMERFQT